MQYLGLGFTLALLAVNLWGLTLAAGLYWRNRWFALAASPLLFTTAVYAIETHHGLGPSLSGLAILGTAVSVLLIYLSVGTWEPEFGGGRWKPLVRAWRAEFAPRNLRVCFGIATAIFLYALLWRLNHPDIDGFSEKIADLSYIVSYMSGTTLPVTDAWFAPYPSTQYYSLQHYAASLLGRLLLLSPGTTYNLAFCFLISMAGTAFSGAVFLATRRLSVSLLLIAGFVLGGTGLTLLVHLTDKNVQPTVPWRFIGSAQMDKPPLGPILRAYNDKYFVRDPEGRPHKMELPGEPFAYSIFLGDYHAPLSGYYIMGISGMAMLLWERTRRSRYACIVGGSVTWVVLANSWVLPLQALAVIAWTLYFWRSWRSLVPAVIGGAAGVWLLAWVYLSAFTASAAGYKTSLRLVPWDAHSPPWLFVLMMLPTIVLIVLGFFSRTTRGPRLALFWLAFLLLTEFFYVTDEYTGQYARFNTTLKWWPWVTTGALMTLAPIVLDDSRRRWVRYTGIFFCLYPCFYCLELWTPFWNRIPTSVGRIDGTAYLTQNEFPRLLLSRLKLEKPGVVVERPEAAGGFTDSAVLPLFAGHRMWLGWFGHELLWRNNREDVRRRHDELLQLYEGERAGAGAWLAGQGVDYILFYRPGDSPPVWGKLNRELAPEYIWCDILTFDNEDGRRVGFWRRAPSGGGPSP